MSLFEKLFRKKSTEVRFDKMPPESRYRLENQNGCLYDFGHCEILDFIHEITVDRKQFVTLVLPEAVNNIRFMQACVNDGKITVQIGIEEHNSTRLVEKHCTYEQTQKMFLLFFDSGAVEDIGSYKPVSFL